MRNLKTLNTMKTTPDWKVTPGSWSVGSNCHKFWVNGPDENGCERVADCGPDESGALGWVKREEHEANARLIASAPELVHALQDCISGHIPYGSDSSTLRARISAINTIANAAIAKALGL